MTLAALLAATPAAQASSFVALGDEAPQNTPSIVTAGDAPTQTASLIYLDMPPAATAFDQERERPETASSKPSPAPLAQASLPTVMRGGIVGEAFLQSSPPAATPAVASGKDAARPAAPAAAKPAPAAAKPADEPRRKQPVSEPPASPEPALPVDPQTTVQ